ncbi:hypothetical protein HQ520_11350 [bacterium]|nr:hypothetical protein [bacterium]
MPEETTSKSPPPRSRLRRMARLFLPALAIFIALILIATLSLFLTADRWLPWAVHRLAMDRGLDLQIDSLQIRSLGRIQAQDIRLALPESKHPAVLLESGIVTYASLPNLLKGRTDTVELRGLRIREDEMVRLQKWLPDQEKKPRKQPIDPYGILAEKIPRRVDLQDASLERPSGEMVRIEVLTTERRPLEGGAIGLDLSVKTGPLDALLGEEMNEPLLVDASVKVTTDSIRLVRLDTNLGQLAGLHAGEQALAFHEGQWVLDLKDTHLDPVAWMESFDIALPGRAEADLRIDRIAVTPPPVGSKPARVEVETSVVFKIESWRDFTEGSSLFDVVQKLQTEASWRQSSRELDLRTSSDLAVGRLELPRRVLENLALRTEATAAYGKDRVDWTARIEGAGPQADSPAPRIPRLHFAGNLTGSAMPATSSAKLDFDFLTHLERQSRRSPDMPIKGSLQYGPPSAGGNLPILAQLGLSLGDGYLSAVGRAEIDAQGEPGEASLSLALHNFSLPDALALLETAGTTIPMTVQGKANGAAFVRYPSDGDMKVGSRIVLRDFQLLLPGIPPIPARPVEILSSATLQGRPVAPGVFSLRNLHAEIANTLALTAGGAFALTTDTLSADLHPKVAAPSLAGLLSLSPIPIPIALDGRLNSSGRLEVNLGPSLSMRHVGENRLADLRIGHVGKGKRFFARVDEVSASGTTQAAISHADRKASHQGPLSLRGFTLDLADLTSDMTTGSLTLASAEFSGPSDWSQTGKTMQASLDGRLNIERLDLALPLAGIHLPSCLVNLKTRARSQSSAIEGITRFDLTETAMRLLWLNLPGGTARDLDMRIGGSGVADVEMKSPGHPEVHLDLTRFHVGVADLLDLETTGDLRWEKSGVPAVSSVDQRFKLFLADLSETLGIARRTGLLKKRTALDRIDLTSGSLRIDPGRLQGPDWRFEGVARPTGIGGKLDAGAVVWRGLSGRIRTPGIALQDVSTATLAQSLEGLDARCGLGGLLAAGIRLDDLRFEARADKGWLNVTPSSFEAYAGRGVLAAQVDLTTWPITVRVQARVLGLDLGLFAQDYNLRKVRMAGRVDVHLSAVYGPAGRDLEARVFKASPRIEVDRVTAFKLLVDWPRMFGAEFLDWGPWDRDRTFRRAYGGDEMVPFDEFEITTRYTDNTREFVNTIVLGNPRFNFTVTNKIDLGIVLEFLRLKQQNLLGVF